MSVLAICCEHGDCREDAAFVTDHDTPSDANCPRDADGRPRRREFWCATHFAERPKRHGEVVYTLALLPRRGRPERERIAAYLEHAGSVEVGSIYTPGSLVPWGEAMGFAAAWVRNRLDEKWEREVLAHAPRATDGEDGRGGSPAPSE